MQKWRKPATVSMSWDVIIAKSSKSAHTFAPLTGMVDNLMDIFICEATIATMRVGVDGATGLNRRFDLGMKRLLGSIGDALRLDDPTLVRARTTAQNTHDDCLAGSASAFDLFLPLVLVHVLRQTADERFIGLGSTIGLLDGT